jgi:hypothetical protein
MPVFLHIMLLHIVLGMFGEKSRRNLFVIGAHPKYLQDVQASIANMPHINNIRHHSQRMTVQETGC